MCQNSILPSQDSGFFYAKRGGVLAACHFLVSKSLIPAAVHISQVTMVPSTFNKTNVGLPWWYGGEESACQQREPGLSTGLESLHVLRTN